MITELEFQELKTILANLQKDLNEVKTAIVMPIKAKSINMHKACKLLGFSHAKLLTRIYNKETEAPNEKRTFGYVVHQGRKLFNIDEILEYKQNQLTEN
jgi:hypothetical protein